MLGRIDADDGKVLPTRLPDTGTDDSIRLLQRSFAAWLGPALFAASSSDVVRHFGFSVIGESKGVNLKLSPQQSKLPTLLRRRFLQIEIVIPGRVLGEEIRPPGRLVMSAQSGWRM